MAEDVEISDPLLLIEDEEMEESFGQLMLAEDFAEDGTEDEDLDESEDGLEDEDFEEIEDENELENKDEHATGLTNADDKVLA